MFTSRVIVPSSLGRTIDSPPITEEFILKALEPYSDRYTAPHPIPQADHKALLPPSAIKPRPTFLDVPQEIRVTVYGYLLTAKHNRIPNPDEPDCKPGDPVAGLGNLTPASYKFHTAILGANHQIREEALKVFKANHFVLIWSNYPLLAKYGLSIRTPLASRDNLLEAATKFKHHLMTMDVQVKFPGRDLATYLKSMQLNRADCSFLIVADDLHLFRKSMHEYNLNLPLFLDSMTLTCKIRTGKVIPDIEQKLLEPLSHFRGFGKVIVGGNVTPAYARELERQMVRKDMTFRQVLEAAYEKKEEGNQAAKRGDWETAGRLWISAMNSIADAATYHPDVVQKATRIDRQRCDKLYVQADLNLILARLKRKDWRSAIENVQLLFKHFGPTMDEEATAKAYYRKGLAYAGLKIEDDAMWCFRKGLEFVAGDEDLKKAVEGLEEKGRERERERERGRVLKEEQERKAAAAEEMKRKKLQQEEQEKQDKGVKTKNTVKRARRSKKLKQEKKKAEEIGE